jgi:hypothetical protein
MIDTEDSWEWRAAVQSSCSVAVIAIGFACYSIKCSKLYQGISYVFMPCVIHNFQWMMPMLVVMPMFVPPWVGIL